MAAHRVTRASCAHKSANLFIDFFSVPCGCQISRNQFHLHLENLPRENLPLLENIPSKRIKDYETSD